MARVAHPEGFHALPDVQEALQARRPLPGARAQPGPHGKQPRDLEGRPLLVEDTRLLEDAGRLLKLAPLREGLAQVGARLGIAALAGQGLNGVQRRPDVGLGLRQLAPAEHRQRVEGQRVGEPERRAASARDLEQVVEARQCGVELVQRHEHRHRVGVGGPVLVAQGDAAGERALDERSGLLRGLAGPGQLGGG